MHALFLDNLFSYIYSSSFNIFLNIIFWYIQMSLFHTSSHKSSSSIYVPHFHEYYVFIVYINIYFGYFLLFLRLSWSKRTYLLQLSFIYRYSKMSWHRFLRFRGGKYSLINIIMKAMIIQARSLITIWPLAHYL